MKIFLASLLLCASASGSILVMDQIGPNGGALQFNSVVSSQLMESSQAAFSQALLDNFSSSSSGTIVRVDAVFADFNFVGDNFADVQSWTVAIYSSLAAAALDLTGNAGNMIVLPDLVTLTPGFAGDGTALVSIPVNLPLAAGNYWIAVMGRLDFGIGSQIGVINSTFAGFPSDLNAVQANPGAGNGFAGNLDVLLNPGMDAAYSVTFTPEPSTFVVLIGGLAAFVIRRYRVTQS